VIALSVSAVLLAGVLLLIPLGLRVGNEPGDAVLLDVEPLTAPRGASVTVTNPGRFPVILGLSLRQAGFRFRLEGRCYVRIRNGHTTSDLLAGNQAWIGVLDAGETQALVVPAGAQIRRRAELVAVIGQERRLRTIHRLVVLGSGAGTSGAGALEARAPRVRNAPADRRGDRGRHQDGRPGADRQSHHVRERERSQAYD
jgi:hypothetical protein